mgnify:CR=1 FL=1
MIPPPVFQGGLAANILGRLESHVDQLERPAATLRHASDMTLLSGRPAQVGG